MENPLLKNLRPVEKSGMLLDILVLADKYTVTGQWKITPASQTDALNEAQRKRLSFNYLISHEDQNYLIHPDDLVMFVALTNRLEAGVKAEFSCRIVSAAGDSKRIEGYAALAPLNEHVAVKQAARSRPRPLNIDFESWAFDVHRNKELLQSIFESSPVGITLAKAVRNGAHDIVDFEVQLANSSTEAQLGIYNLRGHKYSGSNILPSPQVSLSELAKVVEESKTIHRKVLVEKNDRPCWLQLAIVKFDDGILTVSEDISKRIEAEAQVQQQNSLFTKVIESSPDIIQIINLNTGGSAYINRMLLEELGYPFNEIKRIENGKLVKTLIHPDDVALYEGFFRNIRTANNEDTLEAELRWRAYNKRFVWFRTRARVFGRDAHGMPEKVLVFSQNITERKQAEEEKQNLQVLKEMDKARTAFFSNVSHEFRTPLTLLLAPLEEIIRKDTITKSDVERLHMVNRNALRLQKLVNTLLDFSRTESGKMEAVFYPTDLATLTTDLASNFRSVIDQAGLKFRVNCEPLSEPIYVNREMYEKIVFNLISNAFKFTFEGRIEVILKNYKNHVKLIVRDQGIGIAQDQLAKIFDRFVRIEGARSRTFEGSGIGLALVKELVNVHRAGIKVSSEPGEGSEFVIMFPKGKAHLPARSIHESKGMMPGNTLAPAYVKEMQSWNAGDMPEHTRSGRHAKKDPANAKPFVLVVDDNADMRSYLRNLLTDDYDVMEAPNGRVAIDHITPGKLPELVLADVMMPEVDGFELLKTIKTNPDAQDIPVMLLSAKTDEVSKIEGFDEGADDYLVKPFSAQELLARVEARIAIARARRMARQALVDANHQLEQHIQERTTALQVVNAALTAKKAELESVNNDLNAFVSVASHDLNEPLRKIQFFTSMIVDREPPYVTEKGKEYLGKIVSSAGRMKTLVEEIGGYSRSLGDPGAKEPADLNTLLEEAKSDVEHLVIEKNATIVSEHLPVIKCHAVQISQLLQNLLSNSIKFTDAGVAPMIFVGFSLVEGAGIQHPMASAQKRYLRLSVKDNGIGFEPEYKERIFQMFQRLHGKDKYAGTGMGLALCKKIMEHHGGFMLASSTPGKGSTFSCYFPEEVF